MQLSYTIQASLKPNLQAHFQIQGRRIKMQFIRAVRGHTVGQVFTLQWLWGFSGNELDYKDILMCFGSCLHSERDHNGSYQWLWKPDAIVWLLRFYFQEACKSSILSTDCLFIIWMTDGLRGNCIIKWVKADISLNLFRHWWLSHALNNRHLHASH